MFESAKKRLINEYRLTHIDKSSALDNAFMFMNGAIFVDNDKIGKYIEQMTFDDFNDYIKTVFSAVDMLASVEGNFDTRDCYNIIELEEKLGNFSNFDCKASFNKPIIQASLSTEEYNEQQEQTIEIEL